MKSPYPATPELDKIKAVKDKSQALGEFLDIFLTEKGVELCKYHESGNNGKPKYRWLEGVTKARRDGGPTADREPNFSDAFNKDAEHNPEYASWAEGYVPVYTSIQKLLSEFFGIDSAKAEAERLAVLDYVRKSNEEVA